MNKPEQQFWKMLCGHLPRGAHRFRIENSVGQGMPDANVTFNGKEIWMELKVIEGPCLIRKYQHIFGLQHSRAGGRVYVVNKRYAYVEFFAYPMEVESVSDDEKKIVSAPWTCLLKDLTEEFERLFT